MRQTERPDVLVDHADKLRDRVTPNPNRRRLTNPRGAAVRERNRLREVSAQARGGDQAQARALVGPES